jgi:hypothetical protein
VSSTVTGCGRSVTGVDALVNTVVEVGQTTEWALPNSGFFEGCEVRAAAAGSNASATLLQPGKMPDPRDPRFGTPTLTMVGCDIQAPLPMGASGPLGPDIGGHPFPSQQWRLFGNRFAAGGPSANLSKAAVVLVGPIVPTNPATTVVFASEEVTSTPQSQLLFGSGW